jgi:hypothetical protein
MSEPPSKFRVAIWLVFPAKYFQFFLFLGCLRYYSLAAGVLVD